MTRSTDFEIVTALVALDNFRSLRMCERNGLTSQTLEDGGYARVTGHFRAE